MDVVTAKTEEPMPEDPAQQEEADELLRVARRLLTSEAQALTETAKRLSGDFVRVVDLVEACRGRVAVTGMGKASFVAQKVSATLASMGVPSLFLHPADALHGDLGRLRAEDVLLALSHSGETEEMVRLLEPLMQRDIKVVAVTAAKSSTLGSRASLTLEMGSWHEAGSGLAPTTSTTVMLGIGDAIAMAVWHKKGVTAEDFRRFHPGGALGRQLMRVRELMRTGTMVPLVGASARLSEVISVMTTTPGRPGVALVVDSEGRLEGVFTDGDLRRLVEGGCLRLEQFVSEAMTRAPKVVPPDLLAKDAAALLKAHGVDQVAVVEEGRPVGLLDVQDLLGRRGL